MKTCGSRTTMGHGDTAICGKPYYNGMCQCGQCKADDATEALAAMTADRDKYKAFAEQFAKMLYEAGIITDVAHVVPGVKIKIGKTA